MVLTNEITKEDLAEVSDNALEYLAITHNKVLPKDTQEKRKILDVEREELKVIEEKEIKKPKMTITQVIEDLEILKEKFQNQELTPDDDINSFANINGNNLLHEISWITNPRSIFYRLSGITAHDGRNLIANAVYIDFFITSGYPENLGGNLEDITQKEPIEVIDAAVNFYKIIEKVLDDEDTKISIEEFLGTFTKKNSSKEATREVGLTSLSYGEKKIIFEGDWNEFDSYEEYISIRTLVDNILNEMDISEARINKTQDPTTGKNVYTIIDNGPKKENFISLAKLAVENYEQGKKYSDAPGSGSSGGAKIAAFLAGQRGDEFFINDDPNGPKMIQITFSRPKS